MYNHLNFTSQTTTLTTLKTLLTILLILNFTACFSQSKIDSFVARFDPYKWAASIEKKAERLQNKIILRSEKVLRRLQKQEEKVYRRMLHGKDSLLAKAALAEIQGKYDSFQEKLRDTSVSTGSTVLYIPKLDTLSTALKFLDSQGKSGNLKDALAKAQTLKVKFQQAEEIKKFILERKQLLKQHLENLGLTKELKRLNKEVYYYTAQVNEYKEILKDSKKAEKKALELLGKTKLFREFMQKNSQLASLFRLPGTSVDASASNLAGLQTRAQVSGFIQQQLGGGGPEAMDQFRRNLQDAQGKLNELKNKIVQSGGSSSEDIIPEGFRPNTQKTKSFLRRLEYGTNIQTQKATAFFPVTSDIGISAGYKLNDRLVIGIGASYKMGWGRGWNNIRISHQGIGLRSFIDWKLKGSFWISGGYERNYKSAFTDINQLKDLDAWQQNGLAGLSKIVSLKKKFFKKAKVQLLWDFLSYRQMPKSQPILVRIGYSF